jgi:hypothetical protein
MDNLNNNGASVNQEPDKPIRLDKDLDKPIPFDDATSDTDVLHSPLSLGGGDTAKVSRPAEKKSTEKIVSSSERITGVRTFFTKLHAGAIEFMDGQITDWLGKNPDITIKRTNTVTGNVMGKKTEPNIVITVWY